jgi:outer membrane lipoprotein-sorting protein
MLGGDNLASLVDGQHTLRVWYAGPDKARISLLGGNAQTDVIRNGSDAWLWSSKSKTATHAKINESDGDHGAPPTGLPTSPQEAADLALKAIDPSTRVSVGRSTKIAGRDAYELNLTPRDHESLVGQVSIAVDATEHVPLRFRVYPAASDKAAFEVAFTMISFDRPDDAQFTFNPPAGTKVTEAADALEAAEGGKDAKALEDKIAKERAAKPSADQRPTIVGKGWTTVVMTKLDQKAGDEEPAVAGLLGQLPKVSGAWGSGRLFTSHLATGLLTDDGRVFFGAVSPEKLYEVAASHR